MYVYIIELGRSVACIYSHIRPLFVSLSHFMHILQTRHTLEFSIQPYSVYHTQSVKQTILCTTLWIYFVHIWSPLSCESNCIQISLLFFCFLSLLVLRRVSLSSFKIIEYVSKHSIWAQRNSTTNVSHIDSCSWAYWKSSCIFVRFVDSLINKYLWMEARETHIGSQPKPNLKHGSRKKNTHKCMHVSFSFVFFSLFFLFSTLFHIHRKKGPVSNVDITNT